MVKYAAEESASNEQQEDFLFLGAAGAHAGVSEGLHENMAVGIPGF